VNLKMKSNYSHYTGAKLIKKKVDHENQKLKRPWVLFDCLGFTHFFIFWCVMSIVSLYISILEDSVQ